MSMKKLLWVSRHPMTEDQKAGLPTDLQNMEVLHVNQTWAASEDAPADIVENIRIWRSLADMTGTEPGCRWTVAGVFPPVALEALSEARLTYTRFYNLRLLMSISRQAPELRASPDAPIPFVHQRWATVAG